VFPRYDLVTEQRVMSALYARTDVPVPHAPWVETDTAVLGAPFLVMERLHGRVAADDPPFTAGGWVLDLTPDQRAVMCDNALRALTRVHAVDHIGLGLDALDRPELGATPLDQQIADWRATYAWAAEGDVNPTVEAGLDWIVANRPSTLGPIVLNWGDARLGNLLIGDDLSVNGILDWEMVCLGPPEQDLGWWLLMVRHHTEGIGLPLPEGFPERDAVIRRYTELTGHQVQDIDFWEAFAAWKLSILMHRAGNLMIAGGMLPPDAPMKYNNPASQLLAKFIGAPAPTGAAQSFIGNR
jgi:aminoglycoside phosphotransferase (APT) family kinase protein